MADNYSEFKLIEPKICQSCRFLDKTTAKPGVMMGHCRRRDCDNRRGNIFAESNELIDVTKLVNYTPKED